MRKVIKKASLCGIGTWIVLAAFSCNGGTKSFDQEGLKAYARSEKSGWVKSMGVGGVNYSVSYRHPALIAVMEEEPQETKQRRDSLLKTTYWFNIDISVEGYEQSPLRYQLSSLDEYNSRLDYYLNSAANDVWLLDGSDTIRPSSYWFENNHNLVGKETIVVGFDNAGTKSKHIQLAFNDRLFRSGIIKANFLKEDLDKIIIVTDRKISENVVQQKTH